MTKKNSSNSSTEDGNTKHPQQVAPAVHWCFTLNNWTEPEKDDILLVCSNSSKKYIFQGEVGEQGTPHLQGYIQFNKKVRPKGLFSIDRIHWEKARNIEASIAYCKKEDSATGLLWTNIHFPKPLKIIETLRPWQAYIDKIIQGEPDDRSIYWFWEEKGNIGKSAFCKYVCSKYNAICLSGKGSDCKYGIVKYNETKGYYPEIIIFDIPRSNIEYISFEALESIKNGLFYCGKYESQQVIMNSPHIICFANSTPDRSKMSEDRWKIKKL